MNIVKWLIYSSENPENFSLTLKGLVATAIPTIVLISKHLGFTLNTSDAESFGVSVIVVLTGLITLYGAARKVYNATKRKEVVTFIAEKKPKKIAVKKKK